ncbi:SixA phosphatase family protein [Flexivirga meconopsidis]|uniref:SixA phosphatase family protein n=1 Tax=Flexivirga meconopsidis TaxID=2977121 RepID=UPI00223F52CD|nr:histidine phosphatase family protein [Flexivirga meconopsidis]
MTAPRQLIVIRHAKAASPESTTDHERALTPRGVADAKAMGAWLKEQGISVDLVLCSTATRTRETWAAIVEGGKLGALVEHDPRIYNASVERLIGVLREQGRSARSVALVGHAPGIPGLAATLSEGRGDDDEKLKMASGFPTCTAGLLEVEVPWKDLTAGAAELSRVHTARADEASD